MSEDQRATPSAARILVIDDDPALGPAVRTSLVGAGFTVQWVATGEKGMAQVAQWHPDVVILDLGLPDMDGITVCEQIRKWSDVPIIILSARDQDQVKIAALERGADDYLTKPFSPGELLARIRVALRHAAQRAGGQGAAAQVQIGDLRIDFERRLVEVRGEAIHLSPTEYALLTYLARHIGKVMTHQTLLQAVWGPQYLDEVAYLRVAMANLRRKIEQNPSRPVLLLTEPGIGYRLQQPEAG
jgi:two-component system, OmpR family, KDP operon response regulator KdpE